MVDAAIPADMKAALYPLRATSPDNQTIGSYRVEHYSTKQALHRGSKVTLTVFLWSVVSVVLPVIHFVSVPLGILVSPFIGLYYFHRSKGAPGSMTADFVCPDCRAPNHVSAPKIADRYESICVKCQHKIELTPIAEPLTA
jgi:hypothetical protein